MGQTRWTPAQGLGGPATLSQVSGKQGCPADPGPPIPKAKRLAASQASQEPPASRHRLGPLQGQGKRGALRKLERAAVGRDHWSRNEWVFLGEVEASVLQSDRAAEPGLRREMEVQPVLP